MNWSESAPPTASRLQPDPGALAPPACRICGEPPSFNHAGQCQLREGLCQGCWPDYHGIASRRTPEPGALAPAPDALHYRLNAVQLSWLLGDLITRYDRLAWGNRASVYADREAREQAVTEAVAALAPFAELPPPLRRTPSRDGESVLGRLIDHAAQHQREAYAPRGMVAICIQCQPHTWWLSAGERDEHAAEQHGEAR